MRTCKRFSVIVSVAVLAACLPALACADAFDLGNVEAAIYSLPYIEGRTAFKIEDQAFLVSQTPNPELLVHWKVADQSPGIAGDLEARVRILRDDSFPTGETTRWVEEWTMGSGQYRGNAASTFTKTGIFRYRSPVDTVRPVRRYKIVLESKVNSTIQTKVDSTERVIYLAIQPQWREYRHGHQSLLSMAKLAYNRKQSLLRWKDFIWKARLANRSLKDAKGFSHQDLRRILQDTEKLVGRTPTDAEIEEIATNLIQQSGKVLGQLAQSIDAVSNEIMGVTRLGYDYVDASKSLLSRADGYMDQVRYLRNFLVTFLAMEDESKYSKHLDRIVYFCNQELKALSYLWVTRESSELAVMLNKLAKAQNLEAEEITSLGKRLEMDLGRNFQTHAWNEIQKTPIYEKFFPARYIGNKDALCNVLRTVFQGLYYLIKTERFYVDVLRKAVGQSLAAFQATSARVELKPQFEPRMFPEKLQVSVHVTGATIRPGKIAEYPITVRNTDTRSHEVKVVPANKLPSGWFAKMTQDSFLLKPGERRSFVYAITSPYYAQLTQHVRSVLRIFHADQPAHYHEAGFVTRCVVGGEVLSELPDSGRHAQLQVIAQEKARSINPGELTKFSFRVRHNGPTRKLILCKRLSTLTAGWIAELNPERLWLRPGEEALVTLRVTTPLYVKTRQQMEFLVGVGYADEFTRMEKLRFTTAVASLKVSRSRPVLNNDKTRGYFITRAPKSEASFAIANTGNVVDTFDLFLSAPPQGWYVRLPQKFVRLGPGQVEHIPLTLHPPSTIQVGDHQVFEITAVSTSHPEIQHRGKLHVTIINADELCLKPVKPVLRVSPGDAQEMAIQVTNKTEKSMRLAFQPSAHNVHLDWIRLVQPLSELPPGSTRMLYARIRVPKDGPRPGYRAPIHVSAVNELGDEVHACTFELAVEKRHRVDLVLDSTQVRKAQNLLACKLIASNLGTVTDDLVFFLRGKERRYWARISPRRVRLEPGQQSTVTLLVRIPHDAQYDQKAVVHVQAKSVNDSSATDVVEVEVDPKYK